MRTHTLIAVATIALLMFTLLALGVGRMQTASAHVQASVVQTQSKAVQLQFNNRQGDADQETRDNGAAVNGTENDPPDPGETPGSTEDEGQDQSLSGGGHQDQGQVDHQFEGTE